MELSWADKHIGTTIVANNKQPGNKRRQNRMDNLFITNRYQHRNINNPPIKNTSK